MIPALLPLYTRCDIDFTHALGVYVFDKKNNKYLDFSSGYAALALGHCHPKMIEALTEQAKKVWHLSNRFKIPGLMEYCERLVKISGFADTMFMANSGAEAVECMIKMARRYFSAQGKGHKYRFITFDAAFHGRTMACISAGSVEKIKGFEPALDGFDRVPWHDIAAVKAAITDATAGIIMEPVQGEGGMRAADPWFMKEIEKICREKGILLMLDEVQCGMGRTGHMFAYQMYDVKPDLVALGKGIGSGFPVSACLSTEEVGKAMSPHTHGSTFGGNPLAVAVAGAVLDVMTEPNFLPHVNKVSAYLKARLMELKEKHSDYIDSITGVGLMTGIKLKETVDASIASEFCLDEKLLSTYASNNVLRITPPLIITEAHCDEAVDKFDKALLKMHSKKAIAVKKVKKGLKKVKQKLGLV